MTVIILFLVLVHIFQHFPNHVFKNTTWCGIRTTPGRKNPIDLKKTTKHKQKIKNTFLHKSIWIKRCKEITPDLRGDMKDREDTRWLEMCAQLPAAQEKKIKWTSTTIEECYYGGQILHGTNIQPQKYLRLRALRCTNIHSYICGFQKSIRLHWQSPLKH